MLMTPHDAHLQIGSPLFEGLDQIDLTGPFEVLSRIPNSTYRIYGKTAGPVRDLKGLRLTPDAALADAPQLDVLHVPGGFGQEALMEDEEARLDTAAGGRCAQRVLRVHGRLALRRGRPAQGTPGDDALGIVSPAAVLRRDPCE
jgi:transcriptional regulator GlxA family with amidase domain